VTSHQPPTPLHRELPQEVSLRVSSRRQCAYNFWAWNRHKTPLLIVTSRSRRWDRVESTASACPSVAPRMIVTPIIKPRQSLTESTQQRPLYSCQTTCA
jgi:hypothetical protein